MSSITTRMGNTTIEIDGISKSYGNRTFIRDFSYIFLKNDRVGFVGTNGCGKTTLMKMLAGREEPDSGTIKVGQTIKIGYYSQEIESSKEAGIAIWIRTCASLITFVRPQNLSGQKMV